MIAGIPFDAPMWAGARPDELNAIVRHLTLASFHYADDTANEWGAASGHVVKAATEANRLRLSSGAIRLLVKDKPQLVTEEQFLDAVLRQAREAGQ